MKNRANEFIKKMQQRGLTIVLAESVTCGLAAHKLSSYRGVSDVLKGSVVCYVPEAKKKLLGVKQSVMDKYTCESAEVTREMASLLPNLLKADIYAAITGLASAGGSETKTKPVGTIFFCIIYKGKVMDFRQVFRGTPLQIRTKACVALYQLILHTILDQKEN